jgi:hypothetical protein
MSAILSMLTKFLLYRQLDLIEICSRDVVVKLSHLVLIQIKIGLSCVEDCSLSQNTAGYSVDKFKYMLQRMSPGRRITHRSSAHQRTFSVGRLT